MPISHKILQAPASPTHGANQRHCVFDAKGVFHIFKLILLAKAGFRSAPIDSAILNF